MAIKKDLSDVARPASGGPRPDTTPRFVTAVAKAWHQQYLDDGKDTRAMSGDTPFRGSDAGTCSFSLGLSLLERAGLGVRSNPPTLSATWRMNIGTMVHAAMEEILPKAFPGATCEVVGITVEGEASFHADVLIKQAIYCGICDHGNVGDVSNPVACACIDDPKIHTTLFELKTINGTGFKSATIGYRKGQDPEGPRINAVTQAALAAEAFDCDEVVIGYLSMENIGDGIATANGLDDIGKFAAEWTFTREQYQPIAEQERARFRWIKATVDAGRMPDRTVPGLPDGAIITDPTNGSWTVADVGGSIKDIGRTWHCGYCWNQDHCINLARLNP